MKSNPLNFPTYDLPFISLQPDYHASGLIYVIGKGIWIDHLMQTVAHDSRFADTRKTIEDLLDKADIDNLAKFLNELNRNESSVVLLPANLADFHMGLKTQIESLTTEGMTARWSAKIPIISSSSLKLRMMRPGLEQKYLTSITESIQTEFQSLLSELDRQIYEYEKFQSHVSNVMNI